MTIKYWPNQPSMNLNNAVVELFLATEKKILLKRYNNSNKYLYIDILNILTQNELLQTILYELKELILDIIEINLTAETIITIKNKICIILINRVSTKFLLKINKNYLSKDFRIKNNNNYLLDYLLIYLIFGGSYIKDNTFLFENMYTPYNHVKILLENFIIETSNIVVKNLIHNLNHSTNINKVLNEQKICNKLYSSKRSVTLFINNLKLQETIDLYIYDVKALYNERKKIYIINSKNIKLKYIYVSKIDIVKELNQIQILFILWLEIKDLIIPKIEKFIIQIIKYFFYCSINLFSNLILIMIRITVLYLNK